MHVALVEPEIPPNTGSIARLCAATETPLHLIGKLGFTIDDKHLKRAGLDYWPWVDVTQHADWERFRAAVPGRRLGFSARATRPYTAIAFAPGDVLVFRYRRAMVAKHAGIMATPTTMIHALEGAAVCEISLSSWWRRHLAAAFAFPVVSDPPGLTPQHALSLPPRLVSPHLNQPVCEAASLK